MIKWIYSAETKARSHAREAEAKDGYPHVVLDASPIGGRFDKWFCGTCGLVFEVLTTGDRSAVEEPELDERSCAMGLGIGSLS